MTGFVAGYHILPALVLLAGYLLVGAALPIWSARKGDRAAREYRQALADTNSDVLESLRGLRDTLQYQDTAARAAGIAAQSDVLGEKQTAMKHREGVTVGATNTLILLTALAVLAVSVSLYQAGALGAEGVLICTLSALSSFGPVVALANYFLFFGKDVLNVIPMSWRVNARRLFRKKPSKKSAPKAKPIPFPSAGSYEATVAQPKAPYTHKCTVCGRTDVSNPELEFRYCSKCRGYYCYCQDHINNHTHIQ